MDHGCDAGGPGILGVRLEFILGEWKRKWKLVYWGYIGMVIMENKLEATSFLVSRCIRSTSETYGFTVNGSG